MKIVHCQGQEIEATKDDNMLMVFSIACQHTEYAG